MTARASHAGMDDMSDYAETCRTRRLLDSLAGRASRCAGDCGQGDRTCDCQPIPAEAATGTGEQYSTEIVKAADAAFNRFMWRVGILGLAWVCLIAAMVWWKYVP